MTIIIIGRIGHINSRLICVLKFGCKVNAIRQTECSTELCIDALDMHTTEVEHCPTELLSFRVCHNLVLDIIIIDISTYSEKSKPTILAF